MKSPILLKRFGLFLAAMFLIGFSGKTFAAGEHPAYLQALSDLRTARWMIDHHTGTWKATEEETAAVQQIDEAISELRKAGISDDKKITDHANGSANDHGARLHSAYELLNKAKEEVNREEDNNSASGLKIKILKNINEAIRVTKWRMDHV